jgi:cell cycle checkpoint protein
MDPSLHELWTAAESSPFLPAVAKQNQFLVGFLLLLLGLSLSGVFALKPSSPINVPLLGLPASLALAYVYPP